jgi:hypothetical protein
MSSAMIAHPFEIKPSATTEVPDELMITWGRIPSLSVASIYLPAVAAADIITLADKLYVNHRLSVVDDHTIQCPAGNVTFIPIPQGQGRLAGLLSVALSPTVRTGEVYTIAVRQLTQVSATIQPPPPPPPQPHIELATRTLATIADPNTVSWRQVSGAFQYTLTVTPTTELLYPQARLLAWLKWRVGVTPPSNRWLPVLQRYRTLTEGLVWSLGRDPNTIPPSQIGNVPGNPPLPSGGIGSRPRAGCILRLVIALALLDLVAVTLHVIAPALIFAQVASALLTLLVVILAVLLAVMTY